MNRQYCSCTYTRGCIFLLYAVFADEIGYRYVKEIACAEKLHGDVYTGVCYAYDHNHWLYSNNGKRNQAVQINLQSA